MASQAQDQPSAIGPGLVVRGTISGEGLAGLAVEGRVEGTIEIASDLHIAPGAAVEAEVSARGIDVHGELAGTVAASDAIAIHAGARVSGVLRSPRVAIADGASFRGEIDMDVELPGDLDVRR